MQKVYFDLKMFVLVLKIYFFKLLNLYYNCKIKSRCDSVVSAVDNP